MSKNKTEGWICPKCGRVYAPWIDKCQYCGGSTITYTPSTCPYYPCLYSDARTTLNPNNITIKSSPNGTFTNEVKC